MAPREGHFERLARLLDVESRAVAARLAEAARRGAGADAERSGTTIVELAILDESAGLGGRLVVTLTKRNRTKSLPWNRLDVGTPVVLTASEPPEAGHVRGIVCRRQENQMQIVLHEHAELPEADDWRVDLSSDEVATARQRDALRAAAQAHSGRLAQMRAMFLGEQSPRFDAVRTIEPLESTLNPSQRAAIEQALAARDVALIHGPPGTGKTTTLVELVRQAIRRGERVLACAPSHVAVDNLLERLVVAGERVVRLGHPARVQDELREHTLDLQVDAHPDLRVARQLVKEAQALFRQANRYTRAKPDPGARRALRDDAKSRLADARRLESVVVEHLLDAAAVICATTTGLDPAVLGERTFDLVVIDEACQSTEPGCWIPLTRAAGRVVLAGDHCQLPPTVIASDALAEGFGVSLFERLVALHGASITRRLEVQYRMHPTIAQFSSNEFYDGTLEPHASVVDRVLASLPGMVDEPWTHQPLEFIDTAGAECDEEVEPDGESRRNPGEADVVVRRVEALLAAGVPAADVAVITPYAAQVRLLRERLKIEGLEIDSVDGFQGREKEAIVISLVRSNARGEIGFLADARRLNVALTRARRRLTIIGDSATLAHDPFFVRMIEWVERVGAYRSIWEET